MLCVAACNSSQHDAVIKPRRRDARLEISTPNQRMVEDITAPAMWLYNRDTLSATPATVCFQLYLLYHLRRLKARKLSKKNLEINKSMKYLRQFIYSRMEWYGNGGVVSNVRGNVWVDAQ